MRQENVLSADPVLEAARAYPYFEDLNEGVLRQLPLRASGAARPRVLDLGCGYGVLGESIRARGYEVWGLDASPVALSKAESRLDYVARADISDGSALDGVLGDARFDYLVFSDVLEHLPDPESTLRSYRRLLNEGGKVVVSLPNVANWQTRMGLLFGRFEYRDFGVLDRTHLRFFTSKSARRLLEDAGFTIERTDYTPLIARALAPRAKRYMARHGRPTTDPTRAIIDSTPYAWYLRLFYPIEYLLCRIAPGMLAFRIVLVASETVR